MAPRKIITAPLSDEDVKKTVEAALFISGRWMSIDDLAKVANSAAIGKVQDIVAGIMSEYNQSGGVRMVESGGNYRMEVSPEVRDRVFHLAPEPELAPALIKTLALIAYKQPIYQSRVVAVIGNRAYEYIRELRKKEFISIKKRGRYRLLLTTGKFRKYFSLEDGAQFKPDLGSKALEEAQKKLDLSAAEMDGLKDLKPEDLEKLEDVDDDELEKLDELQKAKQKAEENGADKGAPEIASSEPVESPEDDNEG